uniref:Magnesium-dependent phosphatase n=1 Tax=Palpitomonas bilix TaxID=652834 RepID=A0A7S3G1U2_9EUKA|mmetsp:Transcript_15151/g.38275  ORF Transcript_15151/g.38275 Transcript_15151/m.38275 type:complete len:187 (+) Transcript_15151:158-718(+)|eukprot:CAMPEP_0113885098 /NCGR_PEP_ID=MMETSP0780_2-20120614/10698_1 /TAXON_ID=652834 /ORGANISM="Palpitomonas bilix" /LENGTH=186 /DNA_ID=CAMNT_0000872939 /DNA_START=124 /DNA_END=684 /DNA_ORIENTATION=+ /assembly_acc=CAM_ASM_000599
MANPSLDGYGSLPEVFVFDIDYTLWPYHIELSSSPFSTAKRSGKSHRRIGPKTKGVPDDEYAVIDGYGQEISLFSDARHILESIKKAGKRIAVASRTEEPGYARQCLELLNLTKLISYYEIYPGNKDTHLSRIAKSAKVDFSKMVFFDDEMRNIHTAKKLGVHAVYTDGGLTWDYMHMAMENYNRA